MFRRVYYPVSERETDAVAETTISGPGPERDAPLVFHPHARRRTEERGVTEAEVRQALKDGIAVSAPDGRTKHQMIFPFERFRLDKFCRSKLVDVYSLKEGDAVVILTVMSKYF